MNQQAFLRRVREAAQAGRAYRLRGEPVVDPRVGYAGAGADLVGRLVEEVEAAGGGAHVVDDWPQAGQRLAALLDKFGARHALCWRCEELEKLAIDALLEARGIALTRHESLVGLDAAEQRARMLAADVGITGAAWAAAETGTLALASSAGQERSASLLPPVHIALARRSRVVADLFDLFERIGETGEGLPSNISLITGPSKTGDIELRLTTGVHGPGAWHVIIAP